MDGEVLEVPQFIPSVHKSSKQFAFNFAYDDHKVWNELPDDIHSAHLFYLLGRSCNLISSQKPTHPKFYRTFPIVSVGCSLVLFFCVSRLMIFFWSCFLFVAP